MVDLEFVGDYRNPQPLTARQRELGFDGQSDGEFTFDDFLDIINPLQHIPLVSTLYREITGDEISAHARILGDTLFGGPSGFIAAAANAFYEEVAGEDLGESVIAFFTGEEDTAEPQFAGGEAPGNLDPLAAGSNGQAGPAAGPEPDLVIPAGAPLTTAAGSTPVAAAAMAGTPSHAPGQAAGPAGLPPAEDPAMTGMLTGQDALNALFNDLRRTPAAGPALPPDGSQAEALPLPRRGAAMKSYPLPPRSQPPAPAADRAAADASGKGASGEGAAAHPLILAQDASDADIAQRMMNGLDKYRRMSRQAGASETDDRADKAQWHADPNPDDPWRFDPAVPAAGS
ncbi:hypothetical protein [Pelagibius marinus]|uniref:hypothetical protein n=1 Tax=Pelagibius marinus TaxID=2762760 RepID=UPI001873202C|nr:hypothetical protein [Pelagibius marinus]